MTPFTGKRGKGEGAVYFYKGRIWLGPTNRIGCANGGKRPGWGPTRPKKGEPLPPHGLLSATSYGPFIVTMLASDIAGVQARRAAA